MAYQLVYVLQLNVYVVVILNWMGGGVRYVRYSG